MSDRQEAVKARGAVPVLTCAKCGGRIPHWILAVPVKVNGKVETRCYQHRTLTPPNSEAADAGKAGA